MKLNRKWLLVIALVMSLAMATAGTLAYLTDRDTVENVFTMGNVDIEVEEEFDQNSPLYPGVEVDKKAGITNTHATEPAYVWMVVSVPNDLAQYIELGWAGSYSATTVPSPHDGYTGYLVKYPSILDADNSTGNILETVKLAENVDYQNGQYVAVSGGQTTVIGDLSDVKIMVDGFAIQTEGFDGVDAAYTAYTTQWGGLTGGEGGEEGEKPGENSKGVATADELTSALADGGEVHLTQDVVVSQTMNVASGKAVKFNLNGHNLSYAVSNSGASAIINNKGTLEIVGTGTISFVAENPDLQEIPSYATNTITNTGNLTIGKGVTVTNGSDGGASYAVDVTAGKFTLDGGTLTGKRCALRIARYNGDTEFVMNSGTVKAATPAWIQLPGSNANDAPSIKVTINDGTFQTTKASSADNDVLYTYSFGNSHANTSVTINGGNFLGGTVSIGSGYYGDAPTLNITGGTFEYPVLKWTSEGSVQVYPVNNN